MKYLYLVEREQETDSDDSEVIKEMLDSGSYDSYNRVSLMICPDEEEQTELANTFFTAFTNAREALT